MNSLCSVYSILGIQEYELVKLKEREKFIKDGYFVSLNNTKTPIGVFDTPSIDNLIEQCSKIHNKNNEFVRIGLEVLEKVDIGNIQSNIKTEDRALVQIASNFNCLEVAMTTDPANGCLVDNYAHTATQGPAASFGVLSASLYRAHFVPLNGLGQTKTNQINLLSNVKKYFGDPINGKIMPEEMINTEIINDVDAVAKQIKVGVHYDAPIMFGRPPTTIHTRTLNGENVYKLPEPYQVTDQILCSTINLARYDLNYIYNNTSIEKLARACLRASYEGAYLTAIARNRKKMFLTLVGGGVYNNPKDIIINELFRAHNKWSFMSNLEHVYLCTN